MNIDKIVLNPSEYFGSPYDVLTEEELDHDQKLKILQSWEYDIRELLVAEEENMAAGVDEELLEEVYQALIALGE